jgi:tight adherence protein C
VTAVILLGALAGAGVAGVIAGLRPRPHGLQASLRLLVSEPSGVSSAQFPPTSGTWIGKLSRLVFIDRDWILSAAIRRPKVFEQIQTDLSATSSSTQKLSEQVTLCALVGALSPFVLWALVAAAGFGVPLLMPAWAGIAGAASLGALPILRLKQHAKAARRAARRSVGCFLDLVVLALAGGLGIEGAIHSAAAICDTSVSRRIVQAMGRARDSGTTTWDALAGLGRDLGVPELEELAAAVSLAGTEGARVRSTLAAKAASIRSHELADAEIEANTVTERLFLPGVLLLMGFLTFIGYPALSRLTMGL